jgi:hypothetical protein
MRSHGPAADTGTRWNRVLWSDRQLKDHQQGVAPGPRMAGHESSEPPSARFTDRTKPDSGCQNEDVAAMDQTRVSPDDSNHSGVFLGTVPRRRSDRTKPPLHRREEPAGRDVADNKSTVRQESHRPTNANASRRRFRHRSGRGAALVRASLRKHPTATPISLGVRLPSRDLHPRSETSTTSKNEGRKPTARAAEGPGTA